MEAAKLTDRQREDMQFIMEPRQWVHIVLPVKSYKKRDSAGFPQHGIMLNEPRKDGFKVYLCSLFDIPADMSKVEVEKYNSLEELVLEGKWEVD